MAPTPRPYHLSDSSAIPNQLERLLLGLLTGDRDCGKSAAHRVTTLVQSFGQDIIYAVTCGKHKPPKHLLLPYAVKTLTGNIEIIRTLNKFGHGVSYSQLEEKDTALFLQKLATGLNHRVALPASIKPYVFTNLAWIDLRRLSLDRALQWSINFSQIFCVCFIVFLYMSAGCVSTFRTCVQGYLEWLSFVFCFLPSLHPL